MCKFFLNQIIHIGYLRKNVCHKGVISRHRNDNFNSISIKNYLIKGTVKKN